MSDGGILIALLFQNTIDFAPNPSTAMLERGVVKMGGSSVSRGFV